MDLKVIAPVALLVLSAALIAGCTSVEETLDPELEMTVLEVTTKGKSPAPYAVNASEGKEFLYVKVNITNKNEEANHNILGPDRFSVDNNDDTVVEGDHFANMDMRSMDTLLLQEGEGKTFWVVFEVPNDMAMVYLRYEGGIDEPIDTELPVYEHYSGVE